MQRVGIVASIGAKRSGVKGKVKAMQTHVNVDSYKCTTDVAATAAAATAVVVAAVAAAATSKVARWPNCPMVTQRKCSGVLCGLSLMMPSGLTSVPKDFFVFLKRTMSPFLFFAYSFGVSLIF